MAPLQDQECAGALMWFWVTFAYLIPAVAITVQILSPSKTQSQVSMQTAGQKVVGGSLNDAEAEVR
jgi:hypothetical protein